MKQQLTLTPNRRLTAFLLQAHNQQQAAANRRSWPTPAIYPLEAWFTELWQLVLEHDPQQFKPTLSKIQQQVLWEQIIQNSDVGVELLRVAPTAKNALQAWKFLSQWQVSSNKLEPYAVFSTDTAAFTSWLQTYLNWLAKHEYTDTGLMIEQLIVSLPQIIKHIPQDICLMGVDDMPPQYQSLFNTLLGHGINVYHEQIIKPASTIVRTSFANFEQELQAAASWASAKITAKPTEIIGIVIPQLELNRQTVVRIFSSTIAAELMNISAPLSLTNYAIIDTALLILQLAKPTINYADFSILLRSAFIKDSETELNLRAVLDRQLREKVEAKISWENIKYRLSTTETSITQRIDNFVISFAQLQGKHNPEYWVRCIQSLLSAWGWPGERSFTLEETHLLSCWQDLLHEYCQLAHVIDEHTFVQALQYIQRLASETPFLPAETGLTKIHVLGMLEASGLVFSNLWVTGMDRNSWPPDAAPNPFIPLELQRAADIPRSSPQRELKVARRLTATLKQGAENSVIFSYPQRLEDQIMRPSNLIADLPEITITNVIKAKTNASNIVLEQLQDQQGLALDNYAVKSGQSILKSQAQCPFKAYATHRLLAEPLREPELSLSISERGNIVHKVMEIFWQQYKTHNELVSLSAANVTDALMAIVEQVLLEFQRKLPQTLNANYIYLEKIRLLTLIGNWLQFEKTREPFTVHAIEQKITLAIGPLSMSLRLDRVDQVDGGSQIIIDYKTGASDVNAWYAERIVEPQLPLYAMQFDTTVVALAIANVKPQDISFAGVTASSNILPGVKSLDKIRNMNKADSWAAQIAQWRQVLSQTATDFSNGLAAVDPILAKICKQCKLQALCRIYDY